MRKIYCNYIIYWTLIFGDLTFFSIVIASLLHVHYFIALLPFKFMHFNKFFLLDLLYEMLASQTNNEGRNVIIFICF